MPSKRVYSPVNVNYDEWDTSKVKIVEDEENEKPTIKYDGHSPVNLSFVRKNGKQHFWTMYGVKKGRKYELKKGKGRFTDEWDGKWAMSMQLRSSATYTDEDKDDGAMICHIIDDVQAKLKAYYDNQRGDYKMISPYNYTKVDPEELDVDSSKKKKKKDDDDSDDEKKKKKKKDKIVDLSKPLYLAMECPYSIKPGKKKDKDNNIPINARKIALRAFKKTKTGLVETSPEELVLDQAEFRQFNVIPNTTVYLTEGPSRDKIRAKLRVTEVIYSAISFSRESQFAGMDISNFNDMPDDAVQEKQTSQSQPFNFGDMPNDEDNETVEQNLSDDDDILVEDEKPKKKKSTKKSDINVSDDDSLKSKKSKPKKKDTDVDDD